MPTLTDHAPVTGVTYYTEIPSPIGPLLLTSDGQALTGLHMHDAAAADPLDPWRGWGLDHRPGTWIADDTAAPFPATRDQLTAYFAGDRTTFDLPLALHGTDFQRRVWAALLTIPYGTTTSYGELARRLGNPNGSRAVGLANGQNPVAIIVPCHRVIGADGKLTGYGGGLPRKAALLDFEFGVRLQGGGAFPALMT
jgi:methylated-DNA-[protein]-cysteine S-methyltransferase